MNPPLAAALSAPGGCWVRDYLGIYCPGCGATRALYALLDSDVIGSLAFNPVVIVSLVIGLALTGAYAYKRLAGTSWDVRKFRRYSCRFFLVSWLAFSVVRDVLLVFAGIDMTGDFR